MTLKMVESTQEEEQGQKSTSLWIYIIELITMGIILTLVIFCGIYAAKSASEITSSGVSDSDLKTAHKYIITASWLVWGPIVISAIAVIVLLIFLVIAGIFLGPELLLAAGATGAEGTLEVGAEAEESSLASKSLAANQAKQGSKGGNKFLKKFENLIKWVMLIAVLILLLFDAIIGTLCLIGAYYITKSPNYKTNPPNTKLQSARHNAIIASIFGLIPLVILALYLIYRIIMHFVHENKKNKAPINIEPYRPLPNYSYPYSPYPYSPYTYPVYLY